MRSGILWGKKDKNINDSIDDRSRVGSIWDHTAIDSGSRLVLSTVIGKRTEAETMELLEDVSHRCNRKDPSHSSGFAPNKIRTDDYSAYKKAIIKTYGYEVISDDPAENGTYFEPYGTVYTAIKKTRKNGRIVDIEREIKIGLEYINYKGLDKNEYLDNAFTNVVERYNGTDRNLNSRKHRKTYGFSKNDLYHKSSSWLSITYYNFAWDHRSLRVRIDNAFNKYSHRSPAMAAGITTHIWSIEELITYQVIKWFPILFDT